MFIIISIIVAVIKPRGSQNSVSKYLLKGTPLVHAPNTLPHTINKLF